MTELYQIVIDRAQSLEAAWEELELAGLAISFGDEDDEGAKLYVFASSKKEFDRYAWIRSVAPYQLPPIDWHGQWEIHGQDFADGFVHVQFEPYGVEAPALKLEPGAGFGDLSHPTTRMVLELMSKYLDKQIFIDIGCGSGVLSLAAIAMGAPFAYGIDIDPDAIAHSHRNGALNQMDKQVHFYLPEDFQLPTGDEWMIAINMIQSEQELAWASLPAVHQLSCLCLSSGIRMEESPQYVEKMENQGWSLIDQLESEGWVAFVFQK